MQSVRPKFDMQKPVRRARAMRSVLAQPEIVTLPQHVKKQNEQSSAIIQTVPKQRNKSRSKVWLAVPMLVVMGLALVAVNVGNYLSRAEQASGLVLGSATTAYADLDAANQRLNEQDFDSAKDKFTDAQKNLEQAQTQLNEYKLLTLLAPPAKGADNILTGAYFLAEAGKNLSRAMQLFDNLSVTSAGIADQTFTEQLQQNKQLLQNSLLMLSYAQEKFDQASGLPAEYSQTVTHAKEQIATLNNILTDLVNMEDLFLSFFGSEPKTYLLVFQNYDEMRATGGFIGTYGVLKYQNGNINQLKIESVYNIDGSLTKQIAAPGPFQPYITKWAMRDANWFADFPTSAQKLLEFFEMESETADGIIAMTPKMFEDILKLTGPIRMDYYGVTLTSENFQDVVQEQTSIVYDKNLNQPKKFLDDFAPIMLNKLSGFNKEQWFAVLGILKNNFAQKHLLMYSKDGATQNKISGLGLDGKILEAPHDYLSIINTNLGGTKTDLDINQTINYSSQITNSGQIINTVTVVRENTSDLNNLNFVRILVPHGSQLLTSTGFLDKPQPSSQAPDYTTDQMLDAWDKGRMAGNVFIRSESGKTEFTGWVETTGGQTSTVAIKYILPMTVKTSWLNPTQAHSLVFQKQSGSKRTVFNGQWEISSGNVKWVGDGVVVGSDKAVFNSDGTTDHSWGIIFKK